MKLSNNKKIKEAVIAVTYRCNSRCRMCSIWQIKNHEQEFKPEDLNNLPSGLKDVNITGGEPFLRLDLLDIIKTIRERSPKASIIISSNGLATDLIVKRMSEIVEFDENIGVAISIDGIGEAHDKIRGVPGFYERAMKTLDELKRLGVKNLRIGATIGDYNFDELSKIYKLAEDKGVEMSLAVVHSSENFFGQKNPLNKLNEISNSLDWLMKRELKGFHPKHWARAYFAYGLKVFINTGKRILPDYSGKLSIFIDPKGGIYPCDVSGTKIGELSKDLFSSEFLDSACGNSWMICTARQSIKKHKIKAILWMVKNKLSNITSSK